MTLREKQTKFLIMDAKLVLFAAEQGCDIFCTEWFRTLEQQRIYIARGVSKTLYSKHLDGLAKDYVMLGDIKDDGIVNYTPDKYKKLGEFWESLGGRWGGRFGDNPLTEKIEGWDAGHFEFIE